MLNADAHTNSTALPFLENAVCFLYPIVLITLLYVLTILLNFNMSSFVLNMYFGK